MIINKAARITKLGWLNYEKNCGAHMSEYPYSSKELKYLSPPAIDKICIIVLVLWILFFYF